MKITYRNIFKSIVVPLAATMLFSCEGNLEEVRDMDIPEDAPQAIGKGISLKYTQNGELVATLESETMLDFSNKDFPYSEFPDGLVVNFFDEEEERTIITADYGVVYDQTNLIDLQGNVVVITSDSTELTADQLYWDQEHQWVFTDRPNTIQFGNGAVNHGQGFDSNQEFSNFRSRSNIGVQVIDDNE